MRYHLDTSFLVDWQRVHPSVERLREEILTGVHQVSVDAIVQTEFFAVQRVDRAARSVFETVLDLAEWISITPAVSRLAAQWLGPMDAAQRLAHFADALIAAVATVERAILVTGDKRIARVFPVAVLEY